MSARAGWRARLGWWLRCRADRIDPDNAPYSIGHSFTFEMGKGIVFHEGRDHGCPLWYIGKDDYDKAGALIDWETMTMRVPLVDKDRSEGDKR